MSGLWRCSNCGEGANRFASGPAWLWEGDKFHHHCQLADPSASPGCHPCRWFGDGDGRPPAPVYPSGTQHVTKALPALVRERGALVSSADCSEMEIADARLWGRFFVDDSGLGFVLRMRDWLVKAEQLIFDCKEAGDE